MKPDQNHMQQFETHFTEYRNTTNEVNFLGKMGKTHYPLFSYISSHLPQNTTIIDTKTRDGYNALSLSYNPEVKIHTFDSSCKITNDKIKNTRNIIIHYSDIFDIETREIYKTRIFQSSLLLLDFSSEEEAVKGKKEYEFILFLLEYGYQGLILCNNIWFEKEIRDNFWLKIEDKYKYDLSEFGNEKGTGVLFFGTEESRKQKFGFFPEKESRDNWTLVTAYFNLTKCPDASDEIKARDHAYYFHHAVFTLTLPYNLVIYCDQDSLAEIQKYRPKYLEHKTKYMIMEFDNFVISGNSFADFREKINRNRQDKPYHFDNRNTASYYLFCMSRYIMLQNTIVQNPFDSTHFCWINFCMERMGYKNCIHLDEALGVNREKFSTCYIDYIPPETVQDTHEYYRWGRCGMCSGFFTGNAQYMYQTCGAILSKFMEYVDMGYGHADEQLYSPVYFEHPDWFEQYFGDYQEMITNYKFIYDAPEKPLRNFIRNSFYHGFYSKCLEASTVLWRSYLLQKCELTEEQLKDLCYYLLISDLKESVKKINM